MNCPHCNELMTVDFLDELFWGSRVRVRNECPQCHLRVYSVLKEAKKV